MIKKQTTLRNDTTANFGFEAKLWAAADALQVRIHAPARRTVCSRGPLKAHDGLPEMTP